MRLFLWITATRWGGLYINSKLTYQLRNDLNLQNVACEGLFIETPTSSGKLIIGVIYHHPTHAFPSFQDKFIKFVTHLQNKIVNIWSGEILTVIFLSIMNNLM